MLRKLKGRQKIKYQKYKASKYEDVQLDQERYQKIIQNVFLENDFIRQVDEVKSRLPDIDPELIEEVVKFHITKMSEEVIKVRPWKRIIYIYGWARIDIWHLCFNPHSAYFNLARTKKLLTKFKKEINQFLNLKK